MNYLASTPLPLDLRRIPGLPGEMARALQAASVDASIIVLVMFACISLLTLGVADIAWPNGMVAPIGISALLVAPSGSGKSLILRLLMDPVRRFLDDWERGSGRGGRRPLFFIEDATREAVILQLLEWHVAGLFTDEAGLLKKLIGNASATFAKLIDGTPLHHARVSTARAELKWHRFLMCLLEQPCIFEESKMLLGASRGGVGLINRFLVGTATASPSSTAVFKLALPRAVQGRYQERVSSLLTQAIKLVVDKAERPTLRLEGAAEHRLASIAGDVMDATRRETRYASVNEYVTRHAERVLRLAGAMHVFEHGAVGEVSCATLDTAHEIGLWSIESFIALTQQPPKLTQADQDAARVEHELRQMAPWYGNRFLLSMLRRHVANIGMTKPRFDRAIPVLASSGKVTVFVHQGKDWLQIHLPPSPFLPTATWG